MLQWLSFFSNVFLNPLLLVGFLMLGTVFSDVVSIKEADNMSKLKLSNYGVYCIAMTFGIYLLTLLYNQFSLIPYKFLSLYEPTYIWVNLLSAIVTLFTLMVYKQGMEANIFAFIFVPMLLLVSLLHIGINIADAVRHFNFGATPINLNLGASIAIHLFNPFLLLLVLQTPSASDDMVVSVGGESLLVTFLAVFLCYAAWAACHWLVLMLLGKPFDLHVFLGQGQAMGYYLPFMGGVLILLLHIFTTGSYAEGDKWPLWQSLAQLCLAWVVVLSGSLLLLNYLKYLSRI